MKNLTLSTTILLASIILGGSYYLVQVSKQNSIEKQQKVELQEKQTELASECSKKAENFYLNEPSFQYFRKVTSDSNTVWTPPEYHFNTRLQTCLLAWEKTTTLGGAGLKTGGVIDVVSNKTVLKSDSNPLNYDSYVSERNILMSE